MTQKNASLLKDRNLGLESSTRVGGDFERNRDVTTVSIINRHDEMKLVVHDDFQRT